MGRAHLSLWHGGPARAGDVLADHADAELVGAILRAGRGPEPDARLVLHGRIPPSVTAPLFAAAARIPGTDAAARLDAWRRTGFFTGYALTPNPLLFDRERVAFSLRFPDARAKAVARGRLPLVEGIVGIRNFLGLSLEVDVVIPRGVDPVVAEDAIRALVTPVESEVVTDTEEEKPERAPGPDDWPILLALLDGPEKSLLQSAREAGVPPRGIRARVTRLIADRVIVPAPALDFGSAPGVHVRVVVHPADGQAEQAAAALTRRVPHVISIARSPGALIADALLPNLAQAEAAAAHLARDPAVHTMEILFPLARNEETAWHARRIGEEMDS